MNEFILGRVKKSLNLQSYIMNESWLTDCIEYYLNDHENPTQDEIITFVIAQWLLCDLREINNENGSLPKNLTQQKCTTLRGKYILQMDKMYDISISKYKQLENIRRISVEDIQTTENENAAQEGVSQNWQPKPKRMLQLFLTDGIQDVLAIEYKPIRSLKDNLFPGFKLMIKGPVICRKGVILLEEGNISEVGGEVDSLLIPNAIENVFARALHLEENPDPYNDDINKKEQNSQSVQRSIMLEDDFEIDSEVIDQIEKQITEQNSSVNEVNTIIRSDKRNQISESSNNTNNFQRQPSFIVNETQNLPLIQKNQQFNSNSNLNTCTNKKQNPNDKPIIHSNVINSEINDSLSKRFDNFSTSKHISTPSITSIISKPASSLQSIQNQYEDDFPMENEIYDLAEESSSFFESQKPKESFKQDQHRSFNSQGVFSKPSTSKDTLNNLNMNISHEQIKTKDISPKNALKNNCRSDKSSKIASWKFPSPLPSMSIIKPSVSNSIDFPDDDFEMDDFDINTDNYNDYFNKNNKIEINSRKSSQASSNNLSMSNNNVNMEGERILLNNTKNSTNSPSENKSKESLSLQSVGNEFNDNFNNELTNKMNADNNLSINKKHMNRITRPIIEKILPSRISSQSETNDNSTMESSGTKRLSSISPSTSAPQKVRCLQNTPKKKANTTNRKITDFLLSDSADSAIVDFYMPKVCELLCDVLRRSLTDKVTQTTVRGKVKSIIKLNLLKGENGSYFHLDGTITDYTASMDITFSPQVLENIIGYTAQEFSLKRRQSKVDSNIKDQLREDLKKAQQKLRIMDALMDIELKRNMKPMILKIVEMTKEQKEFMDSRVQLLKD